MMIWTKQHHLSPPSVEDRKIPISSTKDWANALQILWVHREIVDSILDRSTADFQSVSTHTSVATERLNTLLVENARTIPSLIMHLAPLIEPKIQRLSVHLKSRLKRVQRMLPLSKLRETSPSCLRKNSRLPGRTTIQKAGPKQKLFGIEKVSHFDTIENRYLLACSIKLQSLCAEYLAISREMELSPQEVRPVKRLLNNVGALINDERLQSISVVKGGEKPSNAMLGNADYRSMWRLWSLLQKREQVFLRSWSRLHESWGELVALALIERISRQYVEFQRVDVWISQAVDTGELILPAVRWLCVQAGYAGQFTLATRVIESGLEITLAFVGVINSKSVERSRICRPRLYLENIGPLGFEDVDLQTSVDPRQKLIEICEDWMRSFDDVRPQDRTSMVREWNPQEYHGLNALNLKFCAATLDVGDESRLYRDWSMISPDPQEDGEVQFGWTAGWNPDSLQPDESMSNDGDSKNKQLMAQALRRFYGLRESACVLPDVWDFEQVGTFMRSVPNMWYIWSSVSLALYVSSQKQLHKKGRYLSISYTDASLDLRVLKREQKDEHWIWIRETGRLKTTQSTNQTSFVQEACYGWFLSENEWEHRRFTQKRVRVENIIDGLRQQRLNDIDGVFVYGLNPSEVSELEQQYPMLEWFPAPEEALSIGAALFVQSQDRKIPTWEDELPKLELEVKRNRTRERIPLYEDKMRLVPGNKCQVLLEEPFTVQKGQPSFRLKAVDEYGIEYSAQCEGAPLPLNTDTKVRVMLDFTHGREGIQGFFRPIYRTAFHRIPFELRKYQKPAFYPPKMRMESAIYDPDEFRKILEIISQSVSIQKNRRRKGRKKSESREMDVVRFLEHQNWGSILRTSVCSSSQSAQIGEQLHSVVASSDNIEAYKVHIPRLRLNKVYSSEQTQDPMYWKSIVYTVLGLRSEEIWKWWKNNYQTIADNKGYLIVGSWIHTFEDIHWFLSIKPETEHQQKFWLRGLHEALKKSELQMPKETKRSVLTSVWTSIQTVSRTKKELLYLYFLNIIELCGYRSEEDTFLQSGDGTIERWLDFLEQLRAELPESIKQHGGSELSVNKDQPIALAMDALRGEYAGLLD